MVNFQQLPTQRLGDFKLPPLKILHVDDVDMNLIVGVAVLGPTGHAIETATSGCKR
jgi:CheY-like chemotaxis protein